MFLKRRIDDQFLADGVPSYFPGEQILIAGLLIAVLCVDDPLVAGFDLAVVLLDRVGDSSDHFDGRGGDGSYCEGGGFEPGDGDGEWDGAYESNGNSHFVCFFWGYFLQSGLLYIVGGAMS